jgi:hypothetical protein
VSGFPVVRKKFLEPFRWMGADAVEDIAEIHERVDLEPFAGLDEAGEDGGGSAAVVAAEEEPVLLSRALTLFSCCGKPMAGLFHWQSTRLAE